MAAFVSVIVPVYNTAPYLEACVRSVLRQTWPDFELILADDGSNDGSGELCERLSEEDERIRVLRLEHKGVSAARNTAMRAARGEYLFFLDSDDEIHPELLRRLCGLAEETGAAMIASDFTKIKEQEFFPAAKGPTGKRDFYLNNQEALFGFCCDRKRELFWCMIGGKAFQKNIVNLLAFDELVEGSEDTRLIYQLLKQGGDVTICCQKWYYYRQREQSASRRPTLKAWYDGYHCYRYISECEFLEGRIKHATEMERRAVERLVKGYYLSRNGRNKDTASFWRKLAQEEKTRPEFSLLPWYSEARLKFELAFHCYPVYLLLRAVWQVPKKWKEGCASWLNKRSVPAAERAARSAK